METVEELRKTLKKVVSAGMKFKRGYYVYHTGHKFIRQENKIEIENRLSRLDLQERSSKNKEFVECISGITRSNLVTHKFEPDYRIWCMSILKEFINYITPFTNPKTHHILSENQLCLVLDMVRQELLINKKQLKVEGEDLFSEVKDLISKYFSKLFLYEELPQNDKRFVSTGADKEGNTLGEWQDVAINTTQGQKLSQELKHEITLVKKYLNQVYDNLERSLYLKEEEKTEIKKEKPINKDSRREEKKEMEASANRRLLKK